MRFKIGLWAALAAFLGIGMGCAEESLSIGEDRCLGDEIACVIPCQQVYDTELHYPEDVRTAEADLLWASVPCTVSECEGITPYFLDFAVHDNGEVTVVGLWGLTSSGGGLLHVTRFDGDGAVLWDHTQARPPESVSDPQSALAVARGDDHSVALAMWDRRQDRADAENWILRVDASGDAEVLGAIPDTGRPLALAWWGTELLLVSDHEASLHRSDGEVVWRQASLEFFPPSADDAVALRTTVAWPQLYSGPDVDFMDATPLILRRDRMGRHSLVQLDPNGNVTWYGYPPPFLVSDVCAASDAKPNLGDVLGARGDGMATAGARSAYESLYNDAFLAIDGRGRPVVAVGGYTVARFPPGLPAREGDSLFAAPGADVAGRASDLHQPPVTGLAIDSQDRIHVLSTVRNGDRFRLAIDRISADLSARETFLLPEIITWTPRQALRIGPQDELYVLGMNSAGLDSLVQEEDESDLVGDDEAVLQPALLARIALPAAAD